MNKLICQKCEGEISNEFNQTLSFCTNCGGKISFDKSEKPLSLNKSETLPSPTPQKSPEVLAHWNYEPDIWRDFLEYESGLYKGSVRATKHLFFAVLILTIVVVLLTLTITLLITDRWNFDMLGPTIVFAFVGCFFLIITGVFWLNRREGWRRLNEQPGKVVISLNGVNTNGISFNWNLSAEFGLSFNKIERKSISVSPGKRFEVLEFYTVIHYCLDGRSQDNYECRVPIPFGKESEAAKIMARLRTSLFSAEQEWIKKNFALGHDFSLGICRKCGDTITESTFFSDIKCRG